VSDDVVGQLSLRVKRRLLLRAATHPLPCGAPAGAGAIDGDEMETNEFSNEVLERCECGTEFTFSAEEQQ